MTYTLFLALLPAGGDWTEFRAHAGRATGDLPITWSESENVRWKTPLPGKAWSSPVVLGDRIWLTNAPADGKQLSAVCIDRANGRVLIDRVVFDNPNPAFCHPANSYASCTPAVEPGRVYVHFGSAGTACLDATTGATIWERRDLKCDHWRAPGSSPIIYQDKLLIQFDGYDVQYVVALDKATGQTLWQTDRNIEWGKTDGDLKKAYGTPLITVVAGKPTMITSAASYSFAYDPETGKEIWRLKHGGMNAPGRPTLAAGLLVVNSGDGGDKLLAIRPQGTGEITATNVAWKYGKHPPKRSTPVAVNDLLYIGADDGFITCLEAATGKEVWSQRVGGIYWASPIATADRVYFFGQEGEMPVIATGREFKLLAKNRLETGGNATPAAVGDELYVRTKTHLYCIGKK